MLPMIPWLRSTGRGPKRSTGCTRPQSCHALTQTPLDLAATVPSGTSPATARPMRELARAYGAARYGDDALAPDDARVAWESLDELEHALDDGVSWTRRWRRRLDASTLVRR